MIFLLLIQLSGCYSYKIISSTDLPLPDSSKNYYIIHSQNSKYLLENTVISNGILSGKIDMEHSYIGSKIQLYLSSDSVIKINTENILSLSLNGIAKVEMAKVEAGKTALLVVSCAIALLLLVGGIAFQNTNCL